jgi:hypothetical protein
VIDHEHLSTYLQDHYAGAMGGLEVAKRSAGANRGSEFGPDLARLADEIAEDRAELTRIMQRLDVSPDQLKTSIAFVAEKLARFKPNGQVFGYSPLSRVVEVESLIAGVNGKLSLWRNLRDLAPLDDRLDGAQLERLEQRAEDQIDRLHDLRRRAALVAFTRTAESVSPQSS